MPNARSPHAGSGHPQLTPGRVRWWVAGTFAMFFARAFLFSTWVSNGPRVKQLLEIDDFELGMVTMLVPLGGLAIVSFASGLTQRFGSKLLSVLGYVVGSASIALLGLSIPSHNLPLTAVLLAVLGACLALLDFLNNLEGTMADKASSRSIFTVVHAAFGIGMLSAAALTGVVSDAGISLGVHFGLIAALALAVGVTACFGIPPGSTPDAQPTEPDPASSRKSGWTPWRERRSQLIALIAFAFVMGESAAGTWVPIALSHSGYSDGRAAFGLSLLWVLMTLGRLFGGFLVDAIGRYRTVQVSALMAAFGVTIFMLTPLIQLPWLGIAAWGLGLAVGFPMSVSAMSDDPIKASKRVAMIITIVYLTNITVGPALGAISQLFGIYVSFLIPLAVLLLAALLSPATKPEHRAIESAKAD